MKDPGIAAGLNLVPIGLGYIYLGRWWRVCLALIGAVLAGVANGAAALMLGLSCIGGSCAGPSGGEVVLMFGAPWLVLALLESWDAWRIASKTRP
jgi:hypothetical protein